MKKYTIEMNYNAFIVLDVFAEDEGQALDKARDMAEDADIRQFTIGAENNAKILYNGMD